MRVIFTKYRQFLRVFCCSEWGSILESNFALHFTSYLSIALFEILVHLKTIKNAKKLLLFDENDHRCLSNFLQTNTFWNFDHISKTYNQIIHRNIWFVKVIILLIMTSKLLFFDVFSKKDPHLNAIEASAWFWKITHFI